MISSDVYEPVDKNIGGDDATKRAYSITLMDRVPNNLAQIPHARCSSLSRLTRVNNTQFSCSASVFPSLYLSSGRRNSRIGRRLIVKHQCCIFCRERPRNFSYTHPFSAYYALRVTSLVYDRPMPSEVAPSGKKIPQNIAWVAPPFTKEPKF